MKGIRTEVRSVGRDFRNNFVNTGDKIGRRKIAEVEKGILGYYRSVCRATWVVENERVLY